jgi:hypothetical protein
MKTKPAKGVKGFIMRTFQGLGHPDSYAFRVYGEPDADGNREFTDYDILHYDLEVEILDDAVLYDDEVGHQYIDYEDYRNE